LLRVNKTLSVYLIVALFIVAYTIGIVNNFYYMAAIPAVLLIALMAFFALDKLILFVTFLTPLAVNLKNSDFRIGVSLPDEPIIFGLMLLFFIKILMNGGFDRKIMKHPITIAILFSLVWMAITTITSSMFIVSAKYFLSRLWFVTVFYFLCTQVFRKLENIKLFIWLYVLALIIIIGYTIENHSHYGFNEQTAHWVMTPFYNDHTAYAAAIALFIPVFFGFTFNSFYNPQYKFWAGVVLVVLLVAIILSYTRASWVGLAAALVIYFVFLFKIKFRYLLLSAMGLGIVLFLFKNDILLKLSKNRQDSSSNYTAHLKSISNISTDASNLERINRWHSALNMFKARPFFGWGPGTYMFNYAGFQNSRDLTIISTNAGNKGNAHSEYIGPLAESGIFGSLSFILILIVVMYKGTILYIRSKNKEIRTILLGLLLGLITYWIHGALNNFLDTDKISVPFWGFIAIITAIDIYHKDSLEPTLTKE
jgi:putative inorganic carbon (HCO3(-)) transporter